MTDLARMGAALAVLACAACAQAPSPAMDAVRVSSVVIGRSSRADVFTALGRPSRTEQSLGGESWIYDSAASDGGGQQLMSGASAASGIAGAFVPFVGLVGSGLGLANAAAGASRRGAEVASLTVRFGAAGIVQDCIYSSTALPAGLPGAADAGARPTGCRRSPPALGG